MVTYYQQARYVRESMESILALDKPAEWEILIGDDGSTDGTIEAAQAYVDRDPEHIRLYVMPREAGRKYNSVERASANRLNLVAHADGDCYCLMDGDDFYSETDFIPEAIAVLEARPEVNVVGFGTWMYPDGAAERRKPGGKNNPVPVHRGHYLRWQYTHAGACVFRRDQSQEEMAELIRLNIFDDNDIMLNALARGKLVRVYRPVYAYRQAEGSVYTAMRPTERAALNVFGLGAGLKYMGPKWEKDVTARFATAVWMAWFLRKNPQEGLESARFQVYLDGCRRVNFHRGEMLLRYPELNQAERREIRRWVLWAGWLSPPRVLYAFLQTHGRRKSS